MEKPSPNHFTASESGLQQAIHSEGLGVASPDHQVGAHFEAVDEGVLVAGLKSIETFFAISTFSELRW